MQQNQNELTKDKLCFVFYQKKVLLKKESKTPFSIPVGEEVKDFLQTAITQVHKVLLPTEETITTFAISSPIEDSDHWILKDLRESYNWQSLVNYKAAGKAYEVLYWDLHSRFCPVCGSATQKQGAIMKKCSNCGYEIYPPIATAIIVLIKKDTEILLVRAKNFRGTFHGLVAGFLEPGETLEECVQREVMEETGLTIKNITYFASQPWPYPCGLMVGFIADYESGTIKLQEDELCAGAFFNRNNLPELPAKLSIARKLIDWWINNGD